MGSQARNVRRGEDVDHLLRVSEPVAALLAAFLPEEDAKRVDVVLLDSARGVTADRVHVIFSSRFVGSYNQPQGSQADPNQLYVAYTRGRLATTVWMEQERNRDGERAAERGRERERERNKKKTGRPHRQTPQQTDRRRSASRSRIHRERPTGLYERERFRETAVPSGGESEGVSWIERDSGTEKEREREIERDRERQRER